MQASSSEAAPAEDDVPATTVYSGADVRAAIAAAVASAAATARASGAGGRVDEEEEEENLSLVVDAVLEERARSGEVAAAGSSVRRESGGTKMKNVSMPTLPLQRPAQQLC